MGPYLVVYEKPDGCVIYRILKSTFNDIGYINSYGWKIISIQIYNEKRHKFEETIPFFSKRYHMNRFQKTKKKSKIKRKIIEIIKIIKE